MSTVRTVLITACTLLLFAIRIAVTPLRQPVSEAANNLPVVVSNTNANPVPVTLGASPVPVTLGKSPVSVTLGSSPDNPLPVSQAPSTPGRMAFSAHAGQNVSDACSDQMVPAGKRFVIQGFSANFYVPAGYGIKAATFVFGSRDLANPGGSVQTALNLIPTYQTIQGSNDLFVATQQITAYAEPGTQIEFCAIRNGVNAGEWGASASLFGYLVPVQ